MSTKIQESEVDPEARAFVLMFLKAAQGIFPGNEGFAKIHVALQFMVQTMGEALTEAEA